jgi:threonine dehydratase
MPLENLISLDSIQQASARLQSVVRQTPLELSKRLSEKYQAEIYLKREDLQEVRSFKIRGAYNFIASLAQAEKERGVVCASAGNHAQGVAYACSSLQIKGSIFMPLVTPNQKIEKVRKFAGQWAQIKLVGNNFDEASQAAREYQQETKAVFVHPFDDLRTIAGQATIAQEIDQQLDGHPEFVLAAVGGGGLAAGISSYFSLTEAPTKVIGVEADTQASMHDSLENSQITTLNKISTFVDGTAVRTPGKHTFEICQELLGEIMLVSEGRVCTDMIELYQNEGIIVEPSGALAVSGLDKMKRRLKGKKVVCVICGGNNDISRYPEVIEKSLIWKGLKHYFILEFTQKPGELRSFVDQVLGPTDDIVRFEYIKKTNKEKGSALVGIELANKNDLEPLLGRLDNLGFEYRRITKSDLLYDYLV